MKIGKGCLYGIGAVFGFIYLLNPSAGVFELLPDTLPIVGHLDEAAAMGILVSSLRGLRRLRSGGRKGTNGGENGGSETGEAASRKA